MSAHKSLFYHLAEAYERYRTERLLAQETKYSGKRLTQLHYLIQHMIPNVGTVIIVIALLWAQSVGALPLGRPQAAPEAASTGTIAYQGRLANAAGEPLNGTYPMIFRLYDVPIGGAPLWTEQWTGSNSVRVSDGLFNVMLGSLNQLPVSQFTNSQSLYLGITVGTDDEMQPRVQLGSVPFAVQALTVPDGSVTTAKIANGAVTQAKLGADVSLVPPDGSITTAKIADGAVTSAKLNGQFPRLLAHKTCDDCGRPSETGGPGWVVVQGSNVQDLMSVTVTTTGNPVLVHMTSRYLRDPARNPWCGIEVLAGGSRIRFAHIDGDENVSRDSGCSGSYLFTDLPSGTYTFRAVAWVNPTATVQWTWQRQIVVYELSGRSLP